MNLQDARKYGTTLITGSVGIGLFVSEVKRIQTLIPSVINYLYLADFVLVGFLIFIWIWATEYELDLNFWLYPKSYKIPSGIRETSIIMLIGLVLVVLFYSARDPLYFSVAFTIYSVVVTIAVSFMNSNELIRAFKDSQKHLKENPDNFKAEVLEQRGKALSELENYFLKRPHILRHIIILIFAFIACIAAILWKSTGQPVWGITAYGVIFLTIFVSEVVIALWRNKRDTELRKIEEALQELGVEIEKQSSKSFRQTR